MRVIHFELPFDDVERATAFYRDAFGWQLDSWGEQADYWLAGTGAGDEAGIDGALARRQGPLQQPVVVIGVESVAKALEQVTAAGGAVVHHTQAVPGVGWSAYVRDPEGNVIGLFQDDPSAG